MIGAPRSYVLDASVAAKWFTRHEEADRDKAVALRAMHQSGRCRLIVPEFFLLEILNAVRFSGRANESDTVQTLLLLKKLRLETASLDWPLLEKALEFAWEYGIALYDSAYVALAELRSAPLLTADAAMVLKMKGHPMVIRLADAELL